jgi:hypothetical protein
VQDLNNCACDTKAAQLLSLVNVNGDAKMVKAALMSLALAALAVTPVAVEAASFSVPASARGFANSQGIGIESYVVGFFGGPQREFRNYFAFTVPSFTGSVTSARLSLNTGTLATNGSFPINYRITSLAALPNPDGSDFALLAAGTLYGERGFISSEGNATASIDLNSAGVAALTSGGTFLVSGRVTDPGTATTHVLFSGTNNGVVTLDFDTVAAPVPEPASWAMLITGFGLTGAVMRRRRMAFA